MVWFQGCISSTNIGSREPVCGSREPGCGSRAAFFPRTTSVPGHECVVPGSQGVIPGLHCSQQHRFHGTSVWFPGITVWFRRYIFSNNNNISSGDPVCDSWEPGYGSSAAFFPATLVPGIQCVIPGNHKYGSRAAFFQQHRFQEPVCGSREPRCGSRAAFFPTTSVLGNQCLVPGSQGNSKVASTPGNQCVTIEATAPFGNMSLIQC